MRRLILDHQIYEETFLFFYKKINQKDFEAWRSVQNFSFWNNNGISY